MAGGVAIDIRICLLESIYFSVPTWAYLLWILEYINVFCSNFKAGELLCFELP
jgi:hypothetical protein